MRHHHTHPARAGLRATALILSTLVLVGLPVTAQAADRGATTSGQAYVRVGQFVPGMQTTTIELEPQDGGAPITLAPDAMYGDVSTYQQVAPGTYTTTVRDTSAATGSSSGTAPLLSRSFEVPSGGARTIAVIGTSDAPRLALLTDDLTPPAAGDASIRVLSASPEAGAVTVQAVGGPVIADQAVSGQASAYAAVPAGSWALQLTSNAEMASLKAVPVASGSVYTVVVLDAQGLGASGGPGVRLQVITDAAGAVTMPQGGAATGGGGTAPGHPGAATTIPWSRPVLGTLAAVVAGGLVLLFSRGRSRRRVGVGH